MINKQVGYTLHFNIALLLSAAFCVTTLHGLGLDDVRDFALTGWQTTKTSVQELPTATKDVITGQESETAIHNQRLAKALIILAGLYLDNSAQKADAECPKKTDKKQRLCEFSKERLRALNFFNNSPWGWLNKNFYTLISLATIADNRNPVINFFTASHNQAGHRHQREQY